VAYITAWRAVVTGSRSRGACVALRAGLACLSAVVIEGTSRAQLTQRAVLALSSSKGVGCRAGGNSSKFVGTSVAVSTSNSLLERHLEWGEQQTNPPITCSPIQQRVGWDGWVGLVWWGGMGSIGCVRCYRRMHQQAQNQPASTMLLDSPGRP
jgi:hypothetical protein